MKTPSDYTKHDGFSNEKGTEKCPHCERVYSPNGGYQGTVYDNQGREYDHLLDTDPGQGPFFCPECWDELDNNRRQQENQSLGDFA